jgi:hypothetical protein
VLRVFQQQVARFLPGHKAAAQAVHDAGRLYLLHSCGKLDEIMDDLIDDVKIDAKHSFEDTIEDVRQAKKTYGRRMGLIGGTVLVLSSHGAEQLIVQRVLACKSVADGRKALALASGDRAARAQAGRVLADALRAQRRNQEAHEVESQPWMN